MLLVVDVGNTQTHFGAFPRGRARRTLALRDGAQLDRRPARRRAAQPARAARRDVRGPACLDRLQHRPAARAGVALDGRALSAPRHARGRARPQTGMPIRIDNPVSSAPTARQRRRRARAARWPLVSVDFGTALNYDVVSADGEYIGGVIAPGVEISIDALTSRGAKLPRRPRQAARGDRQGHRRGDPLGDHLRLRGAGRRHGHAHPRRAQRQRGDDRDRRPGEHIVPFTTTIDEVDDLLTLQGLKLLYERSSS